MSASAVERLRGPCNTPTLDRLAADGLRYSRFHTTPLCSPTRAALLRGRNHHSVGMGAVSDMATARRATTRCGRTRGRRSRRPLSSTGTRRPNSANATKCRAGSGARWGRSTLAPADGFEYFYGFIGGEANSSIPTSTRRRHGRAGEDARGGLPLHGGHHGQGARVGAPQKGVVPDKPFSMYFAPGATHAPHHVPAERVEVQRRVRHGLGRGARGDLRSPEQLGVIRMTPSSRRDTRDPCIPRDAGEAEAGAAAADGAIRRGSWSTPISARARSSTRSKSSARWKTRSSICIIGDNGASAEGRSTGLERVPDITDIPESRRQSSCARRLETSAGPSRTTSTPWAGLTRWTRRTSGRSAWPPTGGAPATA